MPLVGGGTDVGTPSGPVAEHQPMNPINQTLL